MDCDRRLPKRLTFAKYRIAFVNFFSDDISQAICIVDGLVVYENLISIVVQKSAEIDLVETKRLRVSATVACHRVDRIVIVLFSGIAATFHELADPRIRRQTCPFR